MKIPSLTVRQKGDLAIVEMSRQFNQTVGRQAFRETIGRLSEHDTGHILLNMARIKDLNQGSLLELLSQCAGIAGTGRLKFLNVSKRVRARLETAGLRHVFATREDGAWTVYGPSASAGARCAPGSEYFFG